MAVVYSALLPITALSYDERSKWDRLAVMMPYSPAEIVFSKYLMGYIAVGFTIVISIAAGTITSEIMPIDYEIIFSILFSGALALIMLAFNLAIMFKIGVEKGRLLFIFMIAVIVALGAGASDMLFNYFRTNNNYTGFGAILFIGAIVINIISITLAIKFYQKREF